MSEGLKKARTLMANSPLVQCGRKWLYVGALVSLNLPLLLDHSWHSEREIYCRRERYIAGERDLLREREWRKGEREREQESIKWREVVGNSGKVRAT